MLFPFPFSPPSLAALNSVKWLRGIPDMVISQSGSSVQSFVRKFGVPSTVYFLHRCSCPLGHVSQIASITEVLRCWGGSGGWLLCLDMIRMQSFGAEYSLTYSQTNFHSCFQVRAHVILQRCRSQALKTYSMSQKSPRNQPWNQFKMGGSIKAGCDKGRFISIRRC